MEFKNWLEQMTLGTEFVDERQINALYDRFNEVKSIPIIHDPFSNS